MFDHVILVCNTLISWLYTLREWQGTTGQGQHHHGMLGPSLPPQPIKRVIITNGVRTTNIDSRLHQLSALAMLLSKQNKKHHCQTVECLTQTSGSALLHNAWLSKPFCQ
jgi:hypothetical protein